MAIAVDQNYDKAQRKISTANLEQFAGVDCQLLVEKETHRPIIMDGTTIGGKFKCASTDELEAVKAKADSALPLTGGTVTGHVFFNTSSIFGYNTNELKLLEIIGGNTESAGAILRLYENSDPSLAGVFSISTGNEKYLVGFPSGNLLWAGKEVERVNVIGENYIRFESGLQICWGGFSNTNGNSKIIYPVPFNGAVSPMLSVVGAGPTAQWTAQSGSESATGFTCSSFENGTLKQAGVFYLVVGKWK